MRDAIVGFCMFVYSKHLQTIYNLLFTVSQWFQQQFCSENRHAIVLQVSSPAGSCQEISKYEDVFGRRSIELLEVCRNAASEAVCHRKKSLCKIVCTTQVTTSAIQRQYILRKKINRIANWLQNPAASSSFLWSKRSASYADGSCTCNSDLGKETALRTLTSQFLIFV